MKTGSVPSVNLPGGNFVPSILKRRRVFLQSSLKVPQHNVSKPVLNIVSAGHASHSPDEMDTHNSTMDNHPSENHQETVRTEIIDDEHNIGTNEELLQTNDQLCACDEDSVNVDSSIRERENFEVHNNPGDVGESNNSDEKILSTIVQEKAAEIKEGLKVDANKNFMVLFKIDRDLIAFTGISFKILNSLTKLVEMAERGNPNHFSHSAKDRTILCLMKLKLNLSFRCISVLFSMTPQSCKNNFVYMLSLLAPLLEKVIYWPTDEEVRRSLPKCFVKS